MSRSASGNHGTSATSPISRLGLGFGGRGARAAVIAPGKIATNAAHMRYHDRMATATVSRPHRVSISIPATIGQTARRAAFDAGQSLSEFLAGIIESGIRAPKKIAPTTCDDEEQAMRPSVFLSDATLERAEMLAAKRSVSIPALFGEIVRSHFAK